MASLVISTNKKTYLFNCGENIARLCESQRVKTGHIEHIFLTQSKWSHIGGIATIMFHTFALTGKMPIFHGPISNLFKFIRRVSHLSTIGPMFKKSITPAILNDDDHVENETFRFEKIPIKTAGGESAYSYLCKVEPYKGKLSITKTVDKGVPPGELLTKLIQGEDITLDDGTVVTQKDVCFPDSPAFSFLSRY